MKWFLALLLQVLTTLASAQVDSLYAARLTDLEGKPASLERLRGQPMIVNFWARWCAPCRGEIPELARLDERLRNRGLVVVGIALEDNLPNAREFAAAYDMRYASFAASGDGIALMRALGNGKAVVPYTLVVDRGGGIVASKAGPMTREELERHAARVLARR
jgi:thiol-disulfide isomerase/thioredoxin